jgi:hypothetical protein
MKICLCCGAQCAPDAPHCLACGEASFGPASWADAPVMPPAVQDPVLVAPVDGEAPTDPAPADAPAQPTKRGPGRPRKDQGPN